ncbi:MAG: flagellar M-ring protein FliF [Bacillota bacterium]|nr:flagellar M-ring protein FliF [Bacillota bacterium]
MNFAYFFKNAKDKWKSYTKSRRIALLLLFVGAIIGLSYLFVNMTTTKYGLLFSNMDSKDANNIVQKLKEEKIPTKVSGTSIYVPENQVDELRMEMLSSVTFNGGTNGFELFDSTKFGITDAEMKINYQRALEGELERTIKSFAQVDGARVHLVLPDDSAFVKDTESAKASVTLSLKSGTQLSEDQVKAIVALLSGSVKNLKKEDVEVIDNKMNLLTDSSSDTSDTGTSQKQQDVKTTFENKLEESIKSMLEAVYGKDKVKVKVFADLNFDSSEKDIIKFDPQGVIKSQQKTINGDSSGTGNTSSSPVDNNMNNTTGTSTGTSSNGSSEEITNYEISKTEEKIIKAPGSINKLSTSVVIDGNIDTNTKNVINNLVQGAIGFDASRGDTIFVEGVKFNTAAADAAAKDLQEINNEKAAQAKSKLYKTYGLSAAAGFLLIIFIVFLLKKFKKKRNKAMEKIDQVFNDTMPEAETIVPKPIDLEITNDSEQLENEIKSYASKKPDQVIDIVKSWLSEDER